MKNSTKVWLIIASIFVLGGIILSAVIMSANDWDFTKMSTKEYVENTYEISEDFNNISINTETADITFTLAEDGKCKVECYEDEKAKHTVEVDDDTLDIKVDDKRNWLSFIDFNLNKPTVTVYLPKSEYISLFIEESTGNVEIPKDFKFKDMDITASTGNMVIKSSVIDDVKIHTSTGEIRVEDITAGSMELSVSVGDITVTDVTCKGDLKTDVSTAGNELTNVKCKNFTSEGSTGSITLKNVIATDEFDINRSTGSVVFDGSDAKEIFVNTSTGSVSGTLLTDKVFITDSSVGSVNVPKSSKGGTCEITTSTGSINIEIE